MKFPTTLLLTAAILTLGAIGTVMAQDQQNEKGMQGHMANKMGGADSGSMMMQSMGKDSGMSMQKMMSNPDMKARMQKHVDMMQAMLDSDGMSQEDMQAMMDKPEMQEMMKKMKMHMKCSDMMKTGMEGDSSMDKEGTHEEHHPNATEA